MGGSAKAQPGSTAEDRRFGPGRAWSRWAHLAGFCSDEGTFLTLATGGQVNLSGVMLAGIAVGTLGVLDDIAVGQALAVFQLQAANPGLSRTKLFRQGMAVGRDHIASRVDNLVLAYANAALPLFVLLAPARNRRSRFSIAKSLSPRSCALW